MFLLRFFLGCHKSKKKLVSYPLEKIETYFPRSSQMQITKLLLRGHPAKQTQPLGAICYSKKTMREKNHRTKALFGILTLHGHFNHSSCLHQLQGAFGRFLALSFQGVLVSGWTFFRSQGLVLGGIFLLKNCINVEGL